MADNKHFSVKQPLNPSERELKGLRGLSGMPTHPALVHFPIAGYVIAAVLDVLSRTLYTSHEELAHQLMLSATWIMLGGAAISILAAITGAVDWATTDKGTQVRRTANTHALAMIIVTVLVLVDLALRLFRYDDAEFTPTGLMALSIVVGAGVVFGAAFGGALVYEHGFNVEASATTAAWEPNVIDLTTKELEDTKELPEQRADAGESMSTGDEKAAKERELILSGSTSTQRATAAKRTTVTRTVPTKASSSATKRVAPASKSVPAAKKRTAATPSRTTAKKTPSQRSR